MTKRVLLRALAILAALVVVSFVLALYYLPPFTTAGPERFIDPERVAAPALDSTVKGAARIHAERGRYIVTAYGCAGCHVSTGATGPNWNMYLAGGVEIAEKGYPWVVSRNLTPDRETGLGSRTDEEVFRVLRNGQFPSGRIIHGRYMPWTAWSNLSDEDLRAVIAYLRHLRPVRHAIPSPVPARPLADTTALYQILSSDHADSNDPR